MFWHLQAAMEMSAKLLVPHAGSASTIPLLLGESGNPYKSVNVVPDEYLSNTGFIKRYLRENAIVSFVTVFETYLFDILERQIYLNPQLLSNSSMPIEAKELAVAIDGPDPKRWLSSKVTDKFLRNKTHVEMIGKLDVIAKAGVSRSLEAEITEWCEWSLVRNSVVHTARRATTELSATSPRFTANEPMSLQDKDVARVHHLALMLAAAIDRRAAETQIRKFDAELLVRESFVLEGIEDVRHLKSRVHSLLDTSLSTLRVQQILREVKRSAHQNDGWRLSSGDLAALVNWANGRWA